MKDTNSRRFQTYFLPHYSINHIILLTKRPCSSAWIFVVKSVIWTLGAEAINKYVDTIILSKHPATADTVSRYIYNYLHSTLCLDLSITIYTRASSLCNHHLSLHAGHKLQIFTPACHFSKDLHMCGCAKCYTILLRYMMKVNISKVFTACNHHMFICLFVFTFL